MLLNFSLTSSLFCPEGIATADSYSAATHKVIIDSIPGQFTTDDMKAIDVKIGMTLGTIRRLIKRAKELGEVQMIRAWDYRRLSHRHYLLLNINIGLCINAFSYLF